jgi:hypothetical protein
VSGCDSSAVTSFQRIAQLAEKFDFILAFTHLPPALRDQLEVNGITGFEPGTSGDGQAAETLGPRSPVFFPSLDAGVEWCENRILAAGGIDILEPCMPLLAALGRFTPPGTDPSRLLAYLEKLEVERGYLMMRQGEPPTRCTS